MVLEKGTGNPSYIHHTPVIAKYFQYPKLHIVVNTTESQPSGDCGGLRSHWNLGAYREGGSWI